MKKKVIMLLSSIMIIGLLFSCSNKKDNIDKKLDNKEFKSNEDEQKYIEEKKKGLQKESDENITNIPEDSKEAGDKVEKVD